jgi:alpha-amylase
MKIAFVARSFAAPIALSLLSMFATFPSSAASLPDSRAPQIIYEIFTRSFQDSNGDGIGDLDGVTRRLDYLNDGTPNSLGVDAIWLTPIFPSPSYHGYDSTDFEAIETSFGDLASLQRLLREAHRRGIRVLLDMAVNHTSSEHPWFQSSASSENSADRRLYMWRSQPADWYTGSWHEIGNQYYFSSFSDDGSFADLNWENPEVLNRVTDVFRFWAAQGVDGFRLDAARYLIKGPHGEQNMPQTHAVWKHIVAKTREVNPNAYFVGEVWDSAQAISSYYGNGDELDSCFDFPVAEGLRDSLSNRNSNSFFTALNEHLNIQPDPFFTAPIISNHDMDRVASVVNGNIDLQKLGALALLTLPGTPVIYYGDEIGIPKNNGSAFEGDLAKRTPMQWSTDASASFTSSNDPWLPYATTAPGTTVQEQLGDPNSLLATYRSLIRVRKQTPELLNGTLTNITRPSAGLMTYSRQIGNSAVLVVINFGKRKSPSFSIPDPRDSNDRAGKIERVFITSSRTSAAAPGGALFQNGQIHIDALPASTGAIFDLRK